MQNSNWKQMGEGYGTGNGTAPGGGELGVTGKDCMDKTPKE